MMTKPNRSDNEMCFLAMPEGGYVRKNFASQVWATARPLFFVIQLKLCSNGMPVHARGLWGSVCAQVVPRLSCLAMLGPALAAASARWSRVGSRCCLGQRKPAGLLLRPKWTLDGRTRDVYRMQGTHFCGFFSEALKTSLTRDETFSKVESTAEWH